VAKVTTSGSFTEYTIPTVPASPGEFTPGPAGITAGPDGNLWFTDPFSNKVARVTTSGIFTEYSIPGTVQMSPALPTSGYPASITAGPDGNIWFTEAWGNKVAKVVALPTTPRTLVS
jgi:virginiamycin B lyase